MKVSETPLKNCIWLAEPLEISRSLFLKKQSTTTVMQNMYSENFLKNSVKP